VNFVFLEKILWLHPGEGIAATGRIPETLELFQDHFPDFPILPGVLAIEILKQTAEHFLHVTGASQGEKSFLKQIQATKFSLYLKPGDEWESQLRLLSQQGAESCWSARLLHKEKMAVSSQFVLMCRGGVEEIVACSEGGSFS